MKKLKILYVLIIILVIFILVFLLLAYSKYNQVVKSDAKVKLVKTKLIPENEVQLGSPVKVIYVFDVPWGTSLNRIDVSPADGSQEIGKAIISLFGHHWGYIQYNAEITIQSFTNGIIKEGKAKVYYQKNDSQNELSIRIPEFTSLKIKDLKNELTLASPITEQVKAKTQSYYLLISIIIAIIILFLVFLFILRNKRRNLKTLMIWEISLNELKKLELSFAEARITPEICISVLSDIVRNYLEIRFNIKASKQTTNEFLSSMEKEDSPLPTYDRIFLREFMISSDMIKFAKYDADTSLVIDSISKGRDLILKSIPNEKKEINSEK